MASKLHKTMKLCGNRLGYYRMPIAWGVRPVFKHFSKEIDTFWTEAILVYIMFSEHKLYLTNKGRYGFSKLIFFGDKFN